MEFFGSKSELDALTGGTLVVPAVSHANVGELAMDVLIATLRPRYLGPLEDPNVLPVVGNDAFDREGEAGTLSTGLELFHLEGTGLYLLQQRAPACKGRQRAFAADLVEWARQNHVAELVVLCGLDAQYRRERQLEGPSVRYFVSDKAQAELCASAGVTPLERDFLEEERTLHGLLPPWPLLDECAAPSSSSSSNSGAGSAPAAGGLPYTLLGCFASEGDNAPDGMQLARDALQLLAARLQPASGGSSGAGAAAVVAAAASSEQLRAPRSWVGLYGRSYPQEIF